MCLQAQCWKALFDFIFLQGRTRTEIRKVLMEVYEENPQVSSQLRGGSMDSNQEEQRKLEMTKPFLCNKSSHTNVE